MQPVVRWKGGSMGLVFILAVGWGLMMEASGPDAAKVVSNLSGRESRAEVVACPWAW